MWLRLVVFTIQRPYPSPTSSSAKPCNHPTCRYFAQRLHFFCAQTDQVIWSTPQASCTKLAFGDSDTLQQIWPSKIGPRKERLQFKMVFDPHRSRGILILQSLRYPILHAPKFCHLPQGFQNCFCFCSTTFPSHVGTFFRLQWEFQWEIDQNK